MATAGSKEAKQLEQIKNTFDKAYKEMSKTSEADSAMNRQIGSDVVKYNIDFKKSIIEVQEYHTDEDIKKINSYLNAVNSKMFGFIKKVKNLSDSNVASKLNEQIGTVNDREISDIKEKLNIDITGYKRNVNGSTINHIEKRHGENGLQDHSMANDEDIARLEYVLENYDDINVVKENDIDKETVAVARAWQNSDRTPSQIVMYTKKIDGTYYAAIAVPISNAKNIQVISAYINKHKKIEAPELVNMDKSPHPTSKTFDPSASIEIITSGEKEGNKKYSLTDNQSRQLTKKQQEYFKDSKVRDENGSLLTVYHGTDSDFTVFDRGKIGANYWQSGNSAYGGFYFTDKKSSVESYAALSTGLNGKGRVVESYLNITNPLIRETGRDAFEFFDDHSIELLQEADIAENDGIIIKGEKRNLYIAFNSEQIKNIDNTNPTSNPDIKYSLSAPVNKIPLEQRVSGDALLDAQDTLDLARDVGGKTDNNGYVTLYHRTSEENAEKIKRTGKMSAKEDGIFFSTPKAGYNEGYGDTVVEFKIPAEELVLDDIFEKEAYFKIPPSPKSLSGKKQRYEKAVENRTRALYIL